jgi:hypothetical protein
MADEIGALKQVPEHASKNGDGGGLTGRYAAR